MPADDDAVRHGSFVARRQTFHVAVLSTISRLWVLIASAQILGARGVSEGSSSDLVEMARERRSMGGAV